jgi:hypothetical protein
MLLEQLKPNVIVRGPILPEPVQVIVTVPMGESVKLIGKGLTTTMHGQHSTTLSDIPAYLLDQLVSPVLNIAHPKLRLEHIVD